MRRLYTIVPLILRDDFLCYNTNVNLVDLLKRSLDSSLLDLIHRIADESSALGFPIHLVGGSVRDLMLSRPIVDLDLTLEGDAIKLARTLVKKYGGDLTTHEKFFTATWHLQSPVRRAELVEASNSLTTAIIKADFPTTKTISSKLAGLGIGLTPAGDDFLMGAMYAAWMIHPQELAKNITEEIADIAVPLTTSLSGAWLRSAAKGEAGELWHEFFDALIEDKNIYLPMSKILSVGETSGSDALAGFLETIACWRQS